MMEELRGSSVRAVCGLFSALLTGRDSEGFALTRGIRSLTKESHRAPERWPRSFQ